MVFNFHIHDLGIYDLCQKPPNFHGNYRVYLNKLCEQITKSAKILIFFLSGLTQDCLDLSP